MSVTQGRRRKQGRLRTSLGVSLFIHAQLLVLSALIFHAYAPRTADLVAGAEEAVEIATLDAETAREVEAALAREEEAEKKKEDQSTEAPGQVVDLPKPVNEKAPEKARFAAEYNSSVERETKKFGRLDENARSGASAEQRAARPAIPRPSPGRPAKPSLLAMRAPGAGAAGGPPERPTLPSNPTGQDPEAQAGGPEADDETFAPGGGAPQVLPREGQSGLAALMPSNQQLASLVGSGTQDHIDDIDDGSDTSLNARRWKFASFFNRVKDQVRQHWKPGEEYRKRDPTGGIYGSQLRYTVLIVQLRSDGTLSNVNVSKASGVEFLDDVAVEAMRRASPFPNPPRQLLNETGVLRFRCGFFFDASGAPKMRVYRYGNSG